MPSVIIGFLLMVLLLSPGVAMSDPLYGLAPVNPNDNPPTGGGPGNNPVTTAPGTPQTGAPGNPSEGSQGTQPVPGAQTGGQPGLTQPENVQQPNPNTGNAPTFMGQSVPNALGQANGNGISPGAFASPMTDMFQQAGYPAAAAPLAAAVYQPFGMGLFQPNPYQVGPSGVFALTGSGQYDTNINYSPTSPEPGFLYMFSPTLAYSTVNDYGFLSGMASAQLYEYTSGDIPSYLNELGSLSAGTYLGSRIFVGVMDMAYRGSYMQQSGTPLGFLNGVNPYLFNTFGGEVGVALSPLVTFVQTVDDFYFDASSFGAGISNIQTLGETLNYRDPRNYLTGTYSYSQGLFSLFPSFISNGVSGLATHALNETYSIGAGGSLHWYAYTGDPALSFETGSWYGQISHIFNPSLSVSLQGGWNFTQFDNGQLYQDPLVDLNILYRSGAATLGLNAGEFMINETNYGVELGPADVIQAIGYLYYVLSNKTYFTLSGGYSKYAFFSAGGYSNNFFQQSLQTSNSGYYGEYVNQSDGLFWRARKWLLTGLEYRLIDFTTNVPQETVIDNEFIATVSLQFPF